MEEGRYLAWFDTLTKCFRCRGFNIYVYNLCMHIHTYHHGMFLFLCIYIETKTCLYTAWDITLNVYGFTVISNVHMCRQTNRARTSADVACMRTLDSKNGSINTADVPGHYRDQGQRNGMYACVRARLYA